ncbi:zinc finger BED domain-containing protein DAYSLEEPER-like [Silene latifolia]|uniref:zinc finger BED domain-containing protein DAYSLEEPER-like n=1 Tax=Silene latifolia TaxID=37657 RepID=UPI003D77A9D6
MVCRLYQPPYQQGFANFDGGAVIGGLSYLDTYLDDARLDHTLNIDVLKWWKENESKYLVVAEMARDILAIPITTVASESAFSMGSRVLTKWRTSLLPSTADALLTTRSWLFGFDVQESEEELQDVNGFEFDLSDLSHLTINPEDEEDEGDEEHEGSDELD